MLDKPVVVCRLARYMAERGHNLQDVIEGTGLARDTVTKLYYASGKTVSFETMAAVCAFYQCGTGDMFPLMSEEEAAQIRIPQRKKRKDD